MAVKNISLKRYGKLIAISVSHVANNKTYWKTLCDCSELKNIRLDKLTTGRTTSCGCDRKYVRKSIIPKLIKVGILERIRHEIMRYTGF